MSVTPDNIETLSALRTLLARSRGLPVSYARLALSLGVSRSMVRDRIRALRSKGLLRQRLPLQPTARGLNALRFGFSHARGPGRFLPTRQCDCGAAVVEGVPCPMCRGAAP